MMTPRIGRALRSALLFFSVVAVSGVPLLAQEKDKKEDQRGTVLSWVNALLSPGELSDAHKEMDDSRACEKCHIGRKGLDDQRCLECHEPIRERMKKKAGYHGKLKDACHTCHAEHLGRKADIVGLVPETFNHDQALFRLAGKHQDLECDACHGVKKKERKIQKLFFIGVPEECGGCHQDPHEGQFEKRCNDCHSEHAWTGEDLLFNHQTMSSYPLEGRHQVVECVKCHEDMKTFKPLETECRACHEDPHQGQFAVDKSCETCHTVLGWKGNFLNFDHDKDCPYPLIGSHMKVACTECHENGRFRHGKTACLDCHEDPHNSQFISDKTCDACHETVKWTGRDLNFDHEEDSQFGLTGAHALLSCVECHKDGSWRHGKTACLDCHEDVHQGQFSSDKSCTDCHQTHGWTGGFLAFDHQKDSSYPLTGRHLQVTCVECHEDGRYRIGESKCAECHDDPHKGSIKSECEACHLATGFKGPDVIFDHDRQSNFPLTPLHRNTPCTNCHGDLTYKVKGSTCQACHDDVEAFFSGQSYPELVTGIPDTMHGLVKCEDCHYPDDPKAVAHLVQPRCIACHNRDYGTYLGEGLSLIASRIAILEEEGQGSDRERVKAVLDSIRRFAPHNFLYARKLLDAVGDLFQEQFPQAGGIVPGTNPPPETNSPSW